MPKIIPELDGVRAVAVLSVIAFHVGASAGSASGGLLNEILGFGWCGVDLFFVLSGFLITGILIDTKGTPGAFKNFYVRRTLRIFPLYYATLLIFFHVVPAVANLFSRMNQFSPREEIWYWLYLSNWSPSVGTEHALLSHLWSLSIEEQFYVIWPLLVLTLSARAAMRVAIGVALGCALIRLLAAGHVEAPLIYRNTILRADALEFGALCAFFVRNGFFLKQASRWRPVLLGAAVAGLAACIGLSGTSSYRTPMNVVGYSCLGVAFSYLVLWAVQGPGTRLHALLRSRFLRRIGKHSYAMYIFHVPVTSLLNAAWFAHPWFATVHSELPSTALVLVNVIATIAVAFVMALLSWWLLENRFLQLKSRFESANLLYVTQALEDL